MSRGGARVLKRVITRNGRQLWSGTALIAVHQACEAMVPVLIGVIVDSAIGPADTTSLVTWIAVLAGLFVGLTVAYRFGARQLMKGIAEEYELPPEAEDDVWTLTDRERKSMGIQPLPKTLSEAISVMEESELLADTLGERVYDFYLRNKRAEWEQYRGQVSAFERDQMLPVI